MAKDNEQNSAKTHYKMYKAGKKWMFAGLTMVSMIAGSAAVATDTGDLKTGVAEFADDAKDAIGNMVHLGSASADTAATSAYQLVAGSAATVADPHMNLTTPAQIDSNFTVYQNGAEVGPTTSGATTLIPGPGTNGTIAMNKQFDMTHPISMTGTVTIGVATQSNGAGGNTTDSGAVQAAGNALGITFAAADPASLAQLNGTAAGLGVQATWMGWWMWDGDGKITSGDQRDGYATKSMAVQTTDAAGNNLTTTSVTPMSLSYTGAGNYATTAGQSLAGNAITWTMAWTPTTTTSTSATGTMTYTMVAADGTKLGTVSTTQTLPRNQALGLNEKTGWAWSTTKAGVQAGSFTAAQQTMTVNYTGMPSSMASTVLTGNVGDSFGVNDTTAAINMAAPAVSSYVANAPTTRLNATSTAMTVIYTADAAVLSSGIGTNATSVAPESTTASTAASIAASIAATAVGSNGPYSSAVTSYQTATT